MRGAGHTGCRVRDLIIYLIACEPEFRMHVFNGHVRDGVRAVSTLCESCGEENLRRVPDLMRP